MPLCTLHLKVNHRSRDNKSPLIARDATPATGKMAIQDPVANNLPPPAMQILIEVKFRSGQQAESAESRLK